MHSFKVFFYKQIICRFKKIILQKKMTLYYEKKNGFLIVFCSWEQYEDFLVTLNATKQKIDGKECFAFPLEKEKELIKILNYLNMINSKTKYNIEEDDSKKIDRIDFFKSFGKKNFKKKIDDETSKKIDDDDDDDDDEDYDNKKSEYSSSSYDTSSSDNFPKTPQKRSNYSNEQLYFMIEKIQRKISLIEKILEKKLLK